MYARWLFPAVHDLSVRPMWRYRQQIVGRAEGRVLEIGVGSGLNLPHYDSDAVPRVVGIDPESGMLRRAAERGPESQVDADIIQGSAHDLPFPNESFDAAVATLVFCTIPDPEAALDEIRRVLKPGAVLHFLEHVRSPEPSVARWQRRLNPLWKVVSLGCHLDRDPLPVLKKLGYRLESITVESTPFWSPAIFRTVAHGAAVR